MYELDAWFDVLLGMKFFVVAQPGVDDLEPFLKQVYEAYSDYVLKNPFYDLDMPVRLSLFDKHIERIFNEWRPLIGGV